jgi:hypothetical protein
LSQFGTDLNQYLAYNELPDSIVRRSVSLSVQARECLVRLRTTGNPAERRRLLAAVMLSQRADTLNRAAQEIDPLAAGDESGT